MKRRILFVDDESLVMSGLQRMLRSMRDQWEMEFATSGAEALSRMDANPFDLVVSDMRMPVMNGAQLLKETARRFPQTVRFILSGQADNDLIMQCVGTAHQFLAKPCDAEKLKAAVTRTFAVSDLLGCMAIKKIVSRLSTVPSLPSHYVEVMEEIRSPDSSVESVGRIIARDPGMTVKILQLVNSAFFGLSRQISSPTDAAMLLGLETIRSLVLWIQVFSQFPQDGPEFSVGQLSSHSLATGLLAREIVKDQQGDGTMREEAMTAGLLHDLGKLILVANRPGIYVEVRSLALAKGASQGEAEREIMGATHAEIGGYLLGLWGLPFAIVEAVAMHHAPSACGSKAFSPLTAVHVANVLQQRDEPPNGCPRSELDEAYLEELGLRDRLDIWREFSRPAGERGAAAPGDARTAA